METLAFTRGKSIKRSLDIGLAREWPDIIKKIKKSLLLEHYFLVPESEFTLKSYDNEDKKLVIELYYKDYGFKIPFSSKTYIIEYNVEKWEISGTIIEMDETVNPYHNRLPQKISQIKKEFYQNWEPKEIAEKFNAIYKELQKIKT